jgi:hypothetical protein
MDESKNNSHLIWIASFDIGKRNFAFCVEEIDLNQLRTIENIDKAHRYFKDGTSTPEFVCILKQVCSTGRIILLENIDLYANCDKSSKKLDPLVFVNMYNVLSKYKSYWDKCMSFIIEQQMSFGNKHNHVASKLGQHCFSYFVFNYAQFKNTIEFPSYYKTKVLGAGKNMAKRERKLWAVNKAMEILADRGDQATLDDITSRKKRDDVADTIVQLQAYKFLVFIDEQIF